MKTIHKYPVTLDGPGPFPVLMPVGAIVRHIEPSDDGFTLWAESEVEPIGESEDLGTLLAGTVREFQPVGTGRELPEYKAFVGTIIVDGAKRPLVFHVYEV